MIQRAQSLYLLVAALLVGLFFVVGDAWQTFIAPAYPWAEPLALVLGGLTAAVALVAVFLYRNRKQQRAVIGAAMWLDLGLILVVVGTLVARAFGPEPETTVPYSTFWSVLLPIVAYVALRMAKRGVEKDIALVRSMDRIR